MKQRDRINARECGMALGAGITALFLAVPISLAQTRERSNDDMAACLALETRDEQLACIDQALDARDAIAAKDAAERQTASPQTSSAATASDDLQGEIFARITSFEEIEPNAYLIHLDNGQVWRQNRPKRYPLRTDSAVRIYPTKWGSSYRLTDPAARGFIQVERVR